MPAYNAEAIIHGLERQLVQVKQLLRQVAQDYHYINHFGYFGDCRDPRCVEIRTLTENVADEPEPHE